MKLKNIQQIFTIVNVLILTLVLNLTLSVKIIKSQTLETDNENSFITNDSSSPNTNSSSGVRFLDLPLPLPFPLPNININPSDGIRFMNDNNIKNKENIIQFISPTPPPNINSSGGVRGRFCHQGNETNIEVRENSNLNFSNLLPQTTNYTLTFNEQPNFFISLPETTSTEAYFYLDNQITGEELYYDSVSINNSNGIITIDYPENVPSLEDDTIYKWGLVVVCNDDSQRIPSVEGFIHKVESVEIDNEELNLQAVSLENVYYYIENNIWYDALNMLIKLRQSQPDNEEVFRVWQILLRQGGIDETIINADILENNSVTNDMEN